MFQFKEKMLINLVVFVIYASFFCAVVVLFVDIPQISGVSVEGLSARGALSQAVSTALALITGVAAIVLSMRMSSADYKAAQDVKATTASLISSLLSILRVYACYRTAGISKRDDPLLIEKQIQVVSDFLISTTAFAYDAWIISLKDKDQETLGRWRAFFLNMHLLVATKNIENAANLAVALLRTLALITRRDIIQIADSLVDLSKRIDDVDKIISSDILIRAITQSKDDSASDAYQKVFHSKIRYIKLTDVDDPDIDLWLAVIESDNELLKSALDRGASPNVSQGEILSRYKNILKEFAE